MESKSWYQSKTLWHNIIAIMTAVGAVVQGSIGWKDALPTTGLAVFNFILRIVTKQPID